MNPAEIHTFTRESRSGGVRHVIHLSRHCLAPIDETHPCSCMAGAEGRFCWAFLDVMAHELPRVSSDPLVLEVASKAQLVIDDRAAKSGKNGRRN